MYNGLTESLASIEREGGHAIDGYKKSIAVCAQALAQLRDHVHLHAFDSLEEEVVFFKSWKPQIESLYLYYQQLFELEISRTNASKLYDEALLQKALDKIKTFYEEHAFLVRYYRSGATYSIPLSIISK